MPDPDQLGFFQLPLAIFYKKDIDLKAVGVTDIIHVPSNNRFILIGAFYVITQRVGNPKGPAAFIRESGGNQAMTGDAPDAAAAMHIGFKAWPPGDANDPSRAICESEDHIQFVTTAPGTGAGPLVATVAVVGFLVPT